MKPDPIIQELHKIREKHAEEFQNDLSAICVDLKKIEKECGQRVVSFEPKRKDTANTNK